MISARTIDRIRFNNYQALLKRFDLSEAKMGLPPRGALARFGFFCDVSPRYLSHINNGRKHIGSATARKCEEAFGLPTGWMDVSHEDVPDNVTPEKKDFLRTFWPTYENDPTRFRQVITADLIVRLLEAGGTRSS